MIGVAVGPRRCTPSRSPAPPTGAGSWSSPAPTPPSAAPGRAGRGPPRWRACAVRTGPSGAADAWARSSRTDDIRWCPGPPDGASSRPWTSDRSPGTTSRRSASAQRCATPCAPPTPRGSTRRPRPNLAGHFRYGWDLEPRTPFLAVVDGDGGRLRRRCRPASATTCTWPGSRRRDPSRPPAAAATAAAAARGARRAGPRARAYVGRHRRLGRRRHPRPSPSGTASSWGRSPSTGGSSLAEIDWADVERRLADARAHAEDYELVRRTGPTPDDELAALAEMTVGHQRRADRRPRHRGRGLHRPTGSATTRPRSSPRARTAGST